MVVDILFFKVRIISDTGSISWQNCDKTAHFWEKGFTFNYIRCGSLYATLLNKNSVKSVKKFNLSQQSLKTSIFKQFVIGSLKHLDKNIFRVHTFTKFGENLEKE